MDYLPARFRCEDFPQAQMCVRPHAIIMRAVVIVVCIEKCTVRAVQMHAGSNLGMLFATPAHA